MARDGRDRKAVDDEIGFHLDMLERELREEEGMGDEEARREARRRFGDPERVGRRTLNARLGGGPFARAIRAAHGGAGLDLSLVLRRLRRSPGFTAAAALTLGLAVTVNGAVFAVADALFLRELPYEDPGELVALWETGRDSREPTTSAPGNVAEWRRQARTLESVAAFNLTSPVLSGNGPAVRLDGSVATPGLFGVLGVEPLLGRAFEPEDAEQGAELVTVLSHGLWTRLFGADPGVVGRTITLSDYEFRVVGVMPEGFRFPRSLMGIEPAEIWLPMGLDDGPDSRTYRFLHVVARLAPDADVEAAQGEMEALGRRLAGTYPENAGRTALAVPLRDQLFGEQRPLVLLLVGAGGLVLLVACVNMANLLLARGLRTIREAAVQAALGSGRTPLLRQQLLESLVLALLGGAVGAGLLLAGREGLAAGVGSYVGAMADVRVDARVVAFTLAAALAAGAAFGLLPALRLSRVDLRAVIGGRGEGRRGRAGRNALVAAEAALTLVLVVAAGLLGRSFLELMAVPSGVAVDRTVVFQLRPSRDAYPEPEDFMGLYARLEERLQGAPGVEAAGVMSDIPFTSENRSLKVVWDPSSQPDGRYVEYHAVSQGYLEAAGIPVLDGRGFEPSDAPGSPIVGLVDRTLARQIAPSGSAVGTRIALPDSDTAFTVVGVVGESLDDGLDAAPEPRLYLPHAQNTNRAMWMVVRASGDPRALLGQVRPLVAEVDERVPVSDLKTMAAHVGESVARPRGLAWVTGAFGALALLLAAVGIHGVVSQGVAERTREMGVRSALGARRDELVRLVVRESLAVSGAGIALGAVAALLAGRALSSFLFRVEPWDPLVLLSAVGTLVVAAVAAALLPARRAARVDPLVAMRAE